MIIRVKDLRLRTIIGINDWERHKKQDIVINISMEADEADALRSDDIADSVDYKKVTKKIIEEVEKTSFFLIERLAGFILDLLFEDERVKRATVEVDKPHALRYAESVSVQLERSR